MSSRVGGMSERRRIERGKKMDPEDLGKASKQICEFKIAAKRKLGALRGRKDGTLDEKGERGKR